MEPILNSQLPEFSVQAFHNGSFKTVTNNDVRCMIIISVVMQTNYFVK